MQKQIQIIDTRNGYQICKKIVSYNALFDTKKSIIEGKIAFFGDENSLKLIGCLDPTPTTR